jgi:hypothetical protein
MAFHIKLGKQISEKPLTPRHMNGNPATIRKEIPLEASS